MSTTKEQPFTIQEVSALQELHDAFAQGLIKLYQEVFAAPPYEEVFQAEEVQQIFEVLFLQGMVLLAREERGLVIGFCAGLPLLLEERIAQLASNHSIDPAETWYFAELGVAETHRRRGIAQQLVRTLIEKSPVDRLIMRTAATNIASQRVNEGVGFRVIVDMTQAVSQERTDGTVAEDTRIFLQHTRR